MVLAPGTRLGPYEIGSPLGGGGMGEVYRARDTRLDRTVAVKILSAHLSDNPDARDRFEREARAISSLNHPNVCHLYDVGQQDGIRYLVMEYLEGQTLADRLHQGPLPLDQVLKYGVEICEGLEKAHRNGVVHRDLKPGNIMLTKSGAKLMDFGLAKPIVPASPPSSALTRTLNTPPHPLTAGGMIVGTFQYMSPEQVEGKDADARSDIFSLGSVFYEMVTGKRAFDGKTTASTIAAILASEPQSITSLQPMSPPALEHVVKACLAKDQDDRFQTTHDLKLQLKWMAESQTVLGTTRSGARLKSPLLVFALSGITLLALVLLGITYFRRPGVARSIARASILPPEDAEFYSLDLEGGAPAVSPDGRLLASSVRDKTGMVQLWLRGVDSQSGRFLPGTECAGHAFWSPDSRAIGFFANLKLKRINTDGTSLQTICDVRGSPRGGSWSRDGVMLFTPFVSRSLSRVSANGGTPTIASELDIRHAEDSHRWPQFLPDGKHYIFFVRSFDREQTGIYVGSLDSKEHRLALRTGYRAVYVPQGYLLYMREQTLMAQTFDAEKGILTGEPIAVPDRVAFVSTNSDAMFSASDNGILAYYPTLNTTMGWELVWDDRTGKKLGSIGKDFFSGPTISPDGTRVAVAIYDKELVDS